MHKAATTEYLPFLEGTLWKKSPNKMRLRKFQQRYIKISDGVLTWSAEKCGSVKGCIDFSKTDCEVFAVPGSLTQFEVRPRGGVWEEGAFTGAGSGRRFIFDSRESDLQNKSRSEWSQNKWVDIISMHITDVYGSPGWVRENELPTSTHIICIGNCGAGKSTVLNALIGKQLFSGASRGCGLTDKCEKRKSKGLVYVDTPGLAGAENRAIAAKAISTALNVRALCKLLFVITLHCGHVRPEDHATMKLILKALPARLHSNIAIVVNKVSDSDVDRLRDGGPCLHLLQNIVEKASIKYIMADVTAEDGKNQLLKLPTELMEFFSAMPSSCFVPGLAKLDHEEYRHVLNQLKISANPTSDLRREGFDFELVEVAHEQYDQILDELQGYFPVEERRQSFLGRQESDNARPRVRIIETRSQQDFEEEPEVEPGHAMMISKPRRGGGVIPRNRSSSTLASNDDPGKTKCVEHSEWLIFCSQSEVPAIKYKW